jgi:aspartyl-tRNA(Asn)/glutamyl-tRNA(Gln) amidotransferase subunit A
VSFSVEGGASEIARAVNAREVSATEITDATLSRIAEVDGDVGAYLAVLQDEARNAAAEIDRRIAEGEQFPLAGVPLAVKDNMCLEGTRTTCGSKILERWTAPYTATAVRRMLDAGCVPVGKSNLDEFAMGSSCENSALGVTRNPYDLTRVPGGSSGGSAAAVAAYEAAIGLGSDTGGSIREPGAFCNLIGFKPTYGRISRYGLIAFASSLDQIGPLTRTVRDAALAYDAMAGRDPMDATSLAQPVDATATSLRDDLKGLRIGIVREFQLGALGAAMESVYTRAYAELERLGATLVDVALPTADCGLATYYLIAPAECSANLARFDGVRYGLRAGDDHDLIGMYTRTRHDGFGAEVKRRIMLGTYALSAGYYDAYYGRAQRVRTKIVEDFRCAFEQVDFILTPTTPEVAFKLGEKTQDPWSMYLNDYCTVPMSLSGIPAISIPCGLSEASADSGAEHRPLPVGLQIAGPAFSENRLLDAAYVLERAIAFNGALVRP